MNRACLMKLAWNLCYGKDSLWTRVIKSKYKKRGEWCLSQKNSSPLWKGIAAVWELTSANSRWLIGDGKTAKFWEDKWLSNLPELRSLAIKDLPSKMLNQSVSQYVTNSGEWKWENIQDYVTNNTLLTLAGFKAPAEEGIDDEPLWGLTTSGAFSIKSAFMFLNNQNEEGQESDTWKTIWKWRGPQRIRTFLWLAAHERLHTNSLRKTRSISQSDACATCRDNVETSLHAIRDCLKAREVWEKCKFQGIESIIYTGKTKNWIKMNLKETKYHPIGVPWSLLFGIIAWKIWHWRNLTLFENPLSLSKTKINIIKGHALEIKSALESNNSLIKPSKREDLISWTLPNRNWVALNTDGSTIAGSFLSSAGGLLRNDEGRWLCGFTCNVGQCTAFTAELWGVFYGLTLAWDLGISQIRVEIDNNAVLSILKKPNHPIPVAHYKNITLIRSIIELIRRRWNVKIEKVYREANACADYLASMGSKLPLGFVKIESPPIELRALLDADLYGVAHSRFCIP
jgi:ribonuclease HI